MKKISFFALFILVLAGSSFCSLNKNNSASTVADDSKNAQIDLTKFSKAYFAGGCFWCEEAVFESVIGVSEVISGYSGGHTSNPSYEEVGGEQTGHAESIEVYYDPAIVTYSSLVKVYLASIDPTQVQGQGPDHGDSYRSIIFYQNESEKGMAEKQIAELTASKKYGRPIAVQVVPFEKFWMAEDYHQNYVRLHPSQSYVMHESIPRLKRTQAAVSELIKADRKM